MKLAKSIKQEIKNINRESRVKNPFEGKSRAYFDTLKRDGLAIVENFYDEAQCLEVINEINEIIKNKEVWTDKQQSDHRIYGADRISEPISKFFQDDFLTNLAEAYEDVEEIFGFTLAARLEYKADNLGSGGGWHRDRAAGKQIKAILYLADTNEDNGPFQYMIGSHKPLDVFLKQFKYDLDHNKYRFEDELMEEILESHSGNLKTIVGRAGTLLLVDTRGIHRGMPIREGSRYALTNYYFNTPVKEKFTRLFVK